MIERLEQALNAWETVCFIRRLGFDIRMLAVESRERDEWNQLYQGPETHWRSFRQYLLGFRGSNFDVQRFTDLSGWDVDDMAAALSIGGQAPEGCEIMLHAPTRFTATGKIVPHARPELGD